MPLVFRGSNFYWVAMREEENRNMVHVKTNNLKGASRRYLARFWFQGSMLLFVADRTIANFSTGRTFGGVRGVVSASNAL